MKIRYVILSIIFMCAVSMDGQEMTGSTLVEKSIQYHDPTNNWSVFKDTLEFKVKRPGNIFSFRTVYFDNSRKHFDFWAKHEDGVIHYRVSDQAGFYSWNDRGEVPEKVKEKYKMSKDRAIMYRNYYSYLYGMPMKLRDPGTIIHPEVEQTTFHGIESLRIKVEYIPEVGDDTWYFYFHPSTYALLAYQFFHEEEKNDGEYILFDKEYIYQGIKIPAIRNWYYNKDDKFLAADILIKE